MLEGRLHEWFLWGGLIGSHYSHALRGTPSAKNLQLVSFVCSFAVGVVRRNAALGPSTVRCGRPRVDIYHLSIVVGPTCRRRIHGGSCACWSRETAGNGGAERSSGPGREDNRSLALLCTPTHRYIFSYHVWRSVVTSSISILLPENKNSARLRTTDEGYIQLLVLIIPVCHTRSAKKKIITNDRNNYFHGKKSNQKKKKAKGYFFLVFYFSLAESS